MSSLDFMENLPDEVRAGIARGDVPPPRQANDPPDPIRDVRYAIAVAEAEGNWQTADQLRVQQLELVRRGKDEDTWKPERKQTSAFGEVPAPSREDFLRAAEEAEEDGDHERAQSLRSAALRAHGKVDPDLKAQIAEAEAEGDWARWDRLTGQQLAQLRDEPDPLPAPPAPEPLTVPEINAKRQEAEAAGDWSTVDRLNSELLVRARQRREPTMGAPATELPEED